uniref:Uncharacterized protein n=1 Tax=Romanomermis culicivorax TaxID=13658 RepID=A0A915KMX4_ROMCU
LTSLPGTWDEDSFYYLISKEKENGSKYSCIRETYKDYEMTECPISNWSSPLLVNDSFKFYAIRSPGLIIQPDEGACMLLNKF